MPTIAFDERTWVTSDTHFGHAEAPAKYRRPFPDAAAMDDALVEAINATVAPGDRLLHLGDFTGPLGTGRQRAAHAAMVRSRLRCGEIHLVAGNHDPIGKAGFRDLFASVGEIVSVKGWPGGRHRVVLCHYPMRTWQGRVGGSIHLFGHAHAVLPDLGRSHDVGVDANGFAPLRLLPLLEQLAGRDIEIDRA